MRPRRRRGSSGSLWGAFGTVERAAHTDLSKMDLYLGEVRRRIIVGRGPILWTDSPRRLPLSPDGVCQ